MEAIPVKKNQELEMTIVDLSHLGMGVAKIDGYPIFIENALPQEKVQVKIVKWGKNLALEKCSPLSKRVPIDKQWKIKT